jgi:hypothetical protein
MVEPQQIPQALQSCCEDAPCPDVTDRVAASNWLLFVDELEALQAVNPEAIHLNNIRVSRTVTNTLKELHATPETAPGELAGGFGASLSSSVPPHCGQLAVEMQLVFPAAKVSLPSRKGSQRMWRNGESRCSFQTQYSRPQ